MFLSPSLPVSLFQLGNSLSQRVSGRSLFDNFLRGSVSMAADAAIGRIQGLDVVPAVNQAWRHFFDDQYGRLKSVLDGDSSSDSLGTPGTPGTPGSWSPSAQQLEYYGAELAKLYGMDRNTAYNEAMANTAYQRAVADMQMAGLNPASLFSAGRASAAGPGYASGASGGYSSARAASKDDKLPGWIFYGVSALAQAIGSAVTKSASGGAVASQVAQNFMRAFNGLSK